MTARRPNGRGGRKLLGIFFNVLGLARAWPHLHTGEKVARRGCGRNRIADDFWRDTLNARPDSGSAAR